MYFQQSFVLLAIFIFSTNGLLRYTNIKCKTFDPEFVTFERCDLKVLGRGVIGLNLHAKLLQLPVTNASANLAFFKRYNGYKPFLYNVTADLCDFFRNRKRNPFLMIYMNSMAEVSNINHTCPYNHDIIVKDLVLKEEMLRLIPVPAGDYMFKFRVAAYNDWKVEVISYLTTSDLALNPNGKG